MNSISLDSCPLLLLHSPLVLLALVILSVQNSISFWCAAVDGTNRCGYWFLDSDIWIGPWVLLLWLNAWAYLGLFFLRSLFLGGIIWIPLHIFGVLILFDSISSIHRSSHYTQHKFFLSWIHFPRTRDSSPSHTQPPSPSRPPSVSLPHFKRFSFPLPTRCLWGQTTRNRSWHRENWGRDFFTHNCCTYCKVFCRVREAHNVFSEGASSVSSIYDAGWTISGALAKICHGCLDSMILLPC